MSKIREVLGNVNIGDLEHGDISLGSKIGDEGITKLESDIIKAVMEILPKEYTEEDFEHIANPEGSGSVGEFTYAKNGMNFVRERMKGHNACLSELKSKLKGEGGGK